MTSRRELDNLILKYRNAVLYILRTADYPLEYREISSVITDSGMMRGFDLNDMIASLLEMNCIKIFTDKNGIEKYSITESGRNVCDRSPTGVLSNADKRNLLDCTLKVFSFRRKGGKTECSVESPDDLNEKSVFRCCASDGKRDVLKIELAVDSDYYAQMAAKNFNKNPELIYRELIALLTRKQ